MFVSTRGRYALRVMIDLAEHPQEGYIPLKDITDRQEVSEKYLESIIVVLSKAGFVSGVRGKGGGYRLARKPSEYTVGSILRVLDETLAPVTCLAQAENDCPRKTFCKTLPMWLKFNKVVNDFFDNISLEDLVEGRISIDD